MHIVHVQHNVVHEFDTAYASTVRVDQVGDKGWSKNSLKKVHHVKAVATRNVQIFKNSQF